MPVGALRALVRSTNQAAHGVPVTITRPAPENVPVTTTGVWLPPLTEDYPTGSDFQRRDPRKVLAIPRTATLTHIPRGSIVLAPELSTDSATAWRVDGLADHVQADEIRVVLMPS